MKRTTQRYGGPVVTNDVPGCPKGGLLLGTDKTDTLAGLDGDDEIRGLGGRDFIWDGHGNDVLYGGDGNDFLLGIGITLDGDGRRDKFYCGEGKDRYAADKNDYVDSSCEVKVPKGGSG
jgi:Ca2+-binding RTX toxin-like protein